MNKLTVKKVKQIAKKLQDKDQKSLIYKIKEIFPNYFIMFFMWDNEIGIRYEQKKAIIFDVNDLINLNKKQLYVFISNKIKEANQPCQQD